MKEFLSKKIWVGIGVIIILIAVASSLGGLIKSKSSPPTPKKIGVLQVFPVLETLYTGLKQGMADLGYVEGVDVVYDYQNWNQDPTKIPSMVEKFLDEDVDLIYAIAFPSVNEAFNQTKDTVKQVPIVFNILDAPLEIGFIESRKSSGNNMTGIESNFAEVVPKTLEFLKRINPDVKKIGLFTEGFMIPGSSGVLVYNSFKKSAPDFGMTIVEYKTQAEPGPALGKAWDEHADSIKPGDIDFIYHLPSHFLDDAPQREVALGRRLKIVNGMPIFEELQFEGGTFSYGLDMFAAGKQAAVFVDKIFKGTKPSDIPIEFPRKNDLSINLENARAIGITIPDDILELADRILE